jgi:hypothetical protein
MKFFFKKSNLCKIIFRYSYIKLCDEKNLYLQSKEETIFSRTLTIRNKKAKQNIFSGESVLGLAILSFSGRGLSRYVQ